MSTIQTGDVKTLRIFILYRNLAQKGEKGKGKTVEKETYFILVKETMKQRKKKTILKPFIKSGN